MRKAERLFQLVTLLRGKNQIVTADRIAKSLQVSVRTVYRDIQALSLSGVPIEGEAGVGYRLSSSFDIPPVMFTEKEITALMLALQMVKGHSDPILSQGANLAEDKILSILPDKVKDTIDNLPYYVPDLSRHKEETKWHPLLRESCLSHHKVKIIYTDKNDNETKRLVWPLGLMFWGQSWTLLAWCELRSNYRNFRLDRFKELKVIGEKFPTCDNISVQNYFDTIENIDDCSK